MTKFKMHYKMRSSLKFAIFVLILSFTLVSNTCTDSNSNNLKTQKKALDEQIKEVDILSDLQDTLLYNKFGKDVISESKIMEILYGSFDVKDEVALWKPKKADPKIIFDKVSKDGFLHTKIHLSHLFVSDSVQHLIVLTETSIRDENGESIDKCPSCAPLLGAALFKKKSDKWYLQTFEKNLGLSGSYGKLNVPNFVKMGDHSYGFFLEWVKRNNNHYTGGLTILSLTNNTFRILGSLNTWEEYQGDNPELISNLTNCEIDIIPEKNKVFYDIRLKIKGNKPLNEEVKNSVTSYVEETKLFSFKDKEKEYKLSANSFIRSFKTLEQERVVGYKYRWGQDDYYIEK